MRTTEYVLLAGSSLFVIVNPIGTVPAFLAMTPTDTVERRNQMAKLACWVMAGVLLVFAVAGRWIFKLFGITLPTFQMAGSVVLLLIALDMLRAQRSQVQETVEETVAGTAKDDIAITPLAVPMLAGPGAISTAILLHTQAEGIAQRIALYLCILAISVITYFIFRLSSRGTTWLNPIAMKLATRLMGLMLAAVAFQFMVNALRDLKVIPL
jgi:multiple antibiotic resistance protein